MYDFSITKNMRRNRSILFEWFEGVHTIPQRSAQNAMK